MAVKEQKLVGLSWLSRNDWGLNNPNLSDGSYNLSVFLSLFDSWGKLFYRQDIQYLDADAVWLKCHCDNIRHFYSPARVSIKSAKGRGMVDSSSARSRVAKFSSANRVRIASTINRRRFCVTSAFFIIRRCRSASFL